MVVKVQWVQLPQATGKKAELGKEEEKARGTDGPAQPLADGVYTRGVHPRSLEESSEGQGSPPNQGGSPPAVTQQFPFWVYSQCVLIPAGMSFRTHPPDTQGFPSVSDGKESACFAGDRGSIPGWGRSPAEGNGSPLQYSCLENPMDRGAWRATVYGVTKSQNMTE